MPESKVPAGTPKDSTAEFAQAARNGFCVKNSMNEGTEADGGYTVRMISRHELINIKRQNSL